MVQISPIYIWSSMSLLVPNLQFGTVRNIIQMTCWCNNLTISPTIIIPNIWFDFKNQSQNTPKVWFGYKSHSQATPRIWFGIQLSQPNHTLGIVWQSVWLGCYTGQYYPLGIRTVVLCVARGKGTHSVTEVTGVQSV